MATKWIFAAVAALTAMLSACSMATLSGARPVDKGETQVVVAPAFQRVGLTGSARPGGQVEVGGRYGLTDSMDLGVRLWLPLPGYLLDSRIALKRSPHKDRGLDIALNPGVAYIFVPGGDTNASPLHFVTSQVALLFGMHLGGGRQLVVGPKLIDIVSIDGSTYGQTLNMVTLGATVGYVMPMTKTFSLVPEIGVGTLVAGGLTGFGADVGSAGNTLQVSLGLLFGGDKPPEQRCVEVPPLPDAATPAAP